MHESLRSRFYRWGFNLFPAYCATGARITFISHDFREVRIKLPLSWQTRNYVGTIFGGSMCAAIDPVYMLMLIMNL
jgi:acyl-coenzyme A thioesterase PaaI-like protein